jgi:L-arabinose isomerase
VTGAGELLELAMIEHGERVANGSIEVGSTQERAVPQLRQNPALRHLPGTFDFGFIAWFATAGGHHGHCSKDHELTQPRDLTREKNSAIALAQEGARNGSRVCP